MTDSCATCPKVTEARVLFPEQPHIRYCFDCPQGYVGSRFTALLQRLEGRPPVHSCRRAALDH
ncbi:MAG: hypothetical protein ACKVT1_13175 [Dehalococcoidia bacterium]